MASKPCLNPSLYRSAALILLAFLAACNLPTRATSTPSEAGLLFTAAAQTVQAQGTQTTPLSQTPILQTVAASPSFSFPTVSTQPPPLASLTSPPVIPTQRPPTLAPTPIPCDRVKFITDVTIPDNTSMDPGEVFVKTWRLQNAGSCTWTSGYVLTVDGDNVLKAPLTSQLTAGTVPPGGNIDVSVTLTAPDVAGTYRANFKLANPSGGRFGLGDGTKPFWAQVKVVTPAGIFFDFVAQAPLAEWKSGTANNLDTPLTFGGADDDVNGSAKIKDGIRLETGLNSGKILATFPKQVSDGAVAGAFSPYLVQAGDHLRVRLGFMANPGGGCGSGRVRFQIAYLEGGVLTSLGEWRKSCDGKLLAVNIDLTPLKGKTIQIVFLVKADGSFQDDWAVWNSPRIER